MSLQRFNLNGGELCPELRFRPDLAKWQVGCERVKNFRLTPYGAAKRRCGYQALCYLNTSGPEAEAYVGFAPIWHDVRVFPFVASASDRFAVVLGATATRCDMVVIDADTGSTAYSSMNSASAPLSYAPAELAEIAFLHVNDVMYLAHQNHPLTRIERKDTGWTIREADIYGGPWLEEDKDAPSLALTDEATGTPPEWTLTASDALFTDEWVGTLIRLRDPAKRTVAEYWNGEPEGTDIELPAGLSASVLTANQWGAELRLEYKPHDSDTWDVLAVMTSINTIGAAQNYNLKRDTPGYAGRVRLRVHEGLGTDGEPSGTGNMTGKCRATLTVDGDSYAYLRITSVTSATVAVVERLDGREDEITADRWWEGQFSPKNGYPGALAIHDERLWLGGTPRSPMSVWCSRTNDWTDFAAGDDAAAPLSLTLAADNRNTVLWLCTARGLLFIGAELTIFALRARDNSNPIGPTNFYVSRDMGDGAARIQPVWAGDTVFYVQAGGKRLRAIRYDLDNDGFRSEDVSLLGYHLTEDGIVGLAWGDRELYCLTSTGTVAVYAYDRAQAVEGWSELVFSGTIAAGICALLAAGGEADLCLLARETGGSRTWLGRLAHGAGIYREHYRLWDYASGQGLDFIETREVALPITHATLGVYRQDTGASVTTTTPGTRMVIVPGEAYEQWTSWRWRREVASYSATAKVRKLGGYTQPLTVSNATSRGVLLALTIVGWEWESGELQYNNGSTWIAVESSVYAHATLANCLTLMLWERTPGETVKVVYAYLGGAADVPNKNVCILNDAVIVLKDESGWDLSVKQTDGGSYYPNPWWYAAQFTTGWSVPVYLAGTTAYPEAELRPTILNWGDGQLSRKGTATEVWLYVVASTGGTVQFWKDETGATLSTAQAIVPAGNSNKTAGYRVPIMTGHKRELHMVIKATEGYPLTVAALGIDLERSER